jgi:aspartate/methionine/tyrosine aminotransferase
MWGPAVLPKVAPAALLCYSLVVLAPALSLRQRLLREHGVVVVHGSAYGPAGEGPLRISFAGGDDARSLGLQRLREGLEHVLEHLP